MDLPDIEKILTLIDDWHKLHPRLDETSRQQLTTETLAAIRAIAIECVPAEWREENYSGIVPQ